VAHREDRLHDPRVRGVVDQGRRLRVDRDANVGTQRRSSASPDPRRDIGIPLFHPTDHRSRHTDRAGDGGLADAGAQSDISELLAEANRGPSELAIAGVDRSAADRGVAGATRVQGGNPVVDGRVSGGRSS
jgi:hypothetical protein